MTDVYDHHNYTATLAEGSAISVKRGMDNECVDGVVKIRNDQDYRPDLQAVKQGYLKESDVDIAVTRHFTARMKLGMFDPPASKAGKVFAGVNSPIHSASFLAMRKEAHKET